MLKKAGIWISTIFSSNENTKRIKMISLLTMLMLKVAMALLAFVLLITLLFGTHVTLVLMTRLYNWWYLVSDTFVIIYILLCFPDELLMNNDNKSLMTLLTFLCFLRWEFTKENMKAIKKSPRIRQSIIKYDGTMVGHSSFFWNLEKLG